MDRAKYFGLDKALMEAVTKGAAYKRMGEEWL